MCVRVLCVCVNVFIPVGYEGLIHSLQPGEEAEEADRETKSTNS